MEGSGWDHPGSDETKSSAGTAEAVVIKDPNVMSHAEVPIVHEGNIDSGKEVKEGKKSVKITLCCRYLARPAVWCLGPDASYYDVVEHKTSVVCVIIDYSGGAHDTRLTPRASTSRHHSSF